MQPWMILAALMGLGIATLLVAPTLHRRSIGKAQAEADRLKRDRADEFRSHESSKAYEMKSPPEAKLVRDGLILRGVASAITFDGDTPILVVDDAHAEDVEVVISRVRSEGLDR